MFQKIGRKSQEPLERIGLTGPQFDVLMNVHTTPGLTQQMLADRLHVTKGNVSQLIEKLAKKELLVRQRQGRTSCLFATKKGSVLIEEMLPEHDQFIVDQFESLTEEEQRQLLFLLRKLYKG